MFWTGSFFVLAGCRVQPDERILLVGDVYESSENAVNINTAMAIELEKIPHIGEKLALKIVEHRTQHGAFRRAEHLMLIPGISDDRFRQIRSLVRVD